MLAESQKYSIVLQLVLLYCTTNFITIERRGAESKPRANLELAYCCVDVALGFSFFSDFERFRPRRSIVMKFVVALALH